MKEDKTLTTCEEIIKTIEAIPDKDRRDEVTRILFAYTQGLIAAGHGEGYETREGA